ncbi:hypothetical protein Z043_100468 [Scleropages formosus]|uniref:Ig-like domain-containing protein n=1 Tax=Scleropages formosus TaxID=113540 RepID=A0A0N8K396_SCLFO|nr:hypothetical protein Z043_100468 [Scleropages formosus]
MATLDRFVRHRNRKHRGRELNEGGPALLSLSCALRCLLSHLPLFRCHLIPPHLHRCVDSGRTVSKVDPSRFSPPTKPSSACLRPESGTVAILGGNVTATQGDLAYFQCQALGWRPAPTVSWTVEGRAVNADSYNVSSVDWGNLFNTTSTLGVVANNSAPVVCRASVSTIPAPLTGTAFMSVGERFPLQTHRA